MKVMVALENRFYEGPSGKIYSDTVCDYRFWQRYLQVFDEVVIFARVGLAAAEPDKPAAGGPGVRFFRIPMYIGPRQYLGQRSKIIAMAAEAPDHADAYILRVPGRMGTLLWHNLRKRSIPFGVEVVGHTGESSKTCGANFFLRSVLKPIGLRCQRLQCQEAAAAAYVSQSYLQKDFPPGGWSTYYSSIDLRDEAFLTDAQLTDKLRHLQEPFAGKRPFRVCHAGAMGAKYKGQDVLIEAVGRCLRRGLDIELELMGDGKFRPLYEQKAAELGITERVRFLGYVSGGQAVRDEYDRSDMLVFPSLTEGLPRTVIEAMARGLPCVASNVGGIPELLEDAFLTPPGNAEALARKIADIFGKPDSIESIALRNLQKAGEYKYEVLNERRIAFYERVKQAAPRQDSRK